LRRRERLRRLHPGHSGGPAASGTAGKRKMSRTARNLEHRTGGRDRSRLPGLPASGRRRVRGGESRGVDVMNDLHNRRIFLRAAAAASAAWATADLAHVEEALAWAGHQAGKGDATLTVLTRAQADVLDALTSRILPSVDGRPGAHEAGA